jgi:iron complex transport system substrate-binding protein
VSTSPRIVSLLPSATEIVCALGLRESLVGRSHECDYPPGVESLPVCTAPRFEVAGSSREIDDRVRRLAHEALSIYEVDEAMLARLKPDIVVTQSQCEVCAVGLEEVEQAVARGVGNDVRIVSLEADSLAGVWSDVRGVARAVGVEAVGHTLVGRLSTRVKGIAERAHAVEQRPRVLCLEWLDPLMAAGNWMPELIELAGGDSLLTHRPARGAGATGVSHEASDRPSTDAEKARKSRWIEWRDVEAAAPQVIVVAPCGFDIARSREELHLLEDAAAWSTLPAVRDRRVFLADGNQYFNRPGPRLVESVEILAELLHPEAFAFGYEGRAWQRP